MKKIMMIVPLLGVALVSQGQTFKSGDKIVELGIGIGAAQVQNTQYVFPDLNRKEIQEKDRTKPTFTQMIGMEFGVYDINDKSSIGVGFSINNSWGAPHNNIISGSYDYSYSMLTYTKSNRNSWFITDRQTNNRTGSGTAQAHTEIEDINVMAKIAYHYTFIDNLDTYVALGFGVSSYKNLYSGMKFESGFSKNDKTLDRDLSYDTQLVYSYNDLDHVKWENGGSQGRFVLGAYIGARYWITDSWGVHLNAGLTSLSFKKNSNNFNILEIGASYSF